VNLYGCISVHHVFRLSLPFLKFKRKKNERLGKRCCRQSLKTYSKSILVH
jgi:hypothetical protein